MTWQARAECRTAPLEVFFPPDAERGGRRGDVYADAPVAHECLEHALRHDVQAGFAAGRTPRERELLRGLR